MIEIRRQGDELDEIVITINGLVVVHLERMDYGHVWIGLADGEKRCDVNLTSQKAISMNAEINI